MDNKKIGENFKRIREDKGLTIVEFSQVVNTSKSAWSRIENGGKQNLGYVEIIQYCELAGISESDILGENYGINNTGEVKFKNIQYKKFDYDIKPFRLLILILAIISTIISVFNESIISTSSFVFIWLFYFIIEFTVFIFKLNVNVPSISYGMNEYPYLVSKIDKEKLNYNYKSHVQANWLVFICSNIFNIILIGVFSLNVDYNSQVYLMFMVLFTFGWELYISLDYDKKKYFTKRVFFEGSPKKYDLYKFIISFILMIFSILNYWTLLKLSPNASLKIKIYATIFLVFYIIINFARIKHKEYYLSLYTIEFHKK